MFVLLLRAGAGFVAIARSSFPAGMIHNATLPVNQLHAASLMSRFELSRLRIFLVATVPDYAPPRRCL